jgi:peptidoglycan hydrolase-like protein with peptidoglycan-binding domain
MRKILLLAAFAAFVPVAHAQYYNYTPTQYGTPYTTTPYATTPYQTSTYTATPYGGSQQFVMDLSVGSRGQDVTDMQTWLIAHGFDISSISSGATAPGYFGVQTKTALQAFQRSVGLPDSGIFGPATRERMRSGYTTASPIPNYGNGNAYPCGTYYNGYVTPCSNSYSPNPVINGIDGPVSLLVGQSGTWNIRTSTSDNGTLTYTINWGDNSPTSYTTNTGSTLYTQGTSFTHSYNNPGTYSVQVTVRNLNGYIAQSSLTVQVQGTGNNAGSFQVTSPNGGENWQRGSIQTIRWTSPYYFQSTSVDIKLLRFNACNTQICPTIAYAPYIIASNVSVNQNYYSWNVGNVIPDVQGSSSLVSVPEGQYSIQICQRGTNVCDSSDGTFTIYSSQYYR